MPDAKKDTSKMTPAELEEYNKLVAAEELETQRKKDAEELETLRKEKAQREADEKNKPTPAPVVAPAPPPIQHNKKYAEHKIDVEAVMKKKADGGEELRHYLGEPGKKIKTVFIEPHRADQMNRVWHTRKIIYLPEDKAVPDKIKRTLTELEDGSGMYWKDEPIAATPAK